jgi:hypothetical protein
VVGGAFGGCPPVEGGVGRTGGKGRCWLVVVFCLLDDTSLFDVDFCFWAQPSQTFINKHSKKHENTVCFFIK